MTTGWEKDLGLSWGCVQRGDEVARVNSDYIPYVPPPPEVPSPEALEATPEYLA